MTSNKKTGKDIVMAISGNKKTKVILILPKKWLPRGMANRDMAVSVNNIGSSMIVPSSDESSALFLRMKKMNILLDRMDYTSYFVFGKCKSVKQIQLTPRYIHLPILSR